MLNVPFFFGGDDGYRISRSLRFNSADSAYGSYTPGASGNLRKYTISAWIKPAMNAADGGSTFQVLFNGCSGASGSGANNDFIGMYAGSGYTNRLQFTWNYKGNAVYSNPVVYADPTAWGHLVCVLDVDNATASQRGRIYWNGTEITSWASDGRASWSGDTWFFNTSAVTNIGRQGNNSNYANCLMTEVYLINGQTLTPSSFAQTNAVTGSWDPKRYTGTFGVYDRYYDFSDNTSTTTLGYDRSGNGGNLTMTNFSVAAGAGNDSLVDTPTNYGTDTGAGGEVRGNYAVMNPLDISGTLATYSNGNLEVTRSGASLAQAYSSIMVTSGKWYVEMTAGADVANLSPGIITGTTNAGANRYLGQDSFTYGYDPNGQKVNNASHTAYGSSWTSNDVIGMGLDADNGTLTFYKNGVSQGTAFSSLTGPYRFAVHVENGGICNFNFGQRPFAATAPSGFKALCTQNLPEGTITTSVTFTGNASTDGPFIYLNGVPTAGTINGNAITFGTHADKLANGMKLRTSSASYNTAGSNTLSVTSTGAKFKYSRSQISP